MQVEIKLHQITQGGAASDKSNAPSVSIAKGRELMKKRIGKDGTTASSSSFYIGAGKILYHRNKNMIFQISAAIIQFLLTQK